MTGLTALVREIEQHVAEAGWDQPARLFALVATAELVAREPHLAALLGVGPGDDSSVTASVGHGGDLTPVEQEDLPSGDTLEELLAGIAWPDDVVGAALAVERAVLPPEAEDGLPADEADALSVLAAHPLREDVRLVVAVLRDGGRSCALRARGHDSLDAVLTGPDLVPGLVDALAATLQS